MVGGRGDAGHGGAWPRAPSPSNQALSCRIQCPALVGLVANMLGVILSATGIPVSTKEGGTDAQGPLPGELLGPSDRQEAASREGTPMKQL